MSQPTKQTAGGRAYLDLQNRARRIQDQTWPGCSILAARFRGGSCGRCRVRRSRGGRGARRATLGALILGMELAALETWRRKATLSSTSGQAYAAKMASPAGTTMWTIAQRFYNRARAQDQSHVMHPGRDPLP